MKLTVSKQKISTEPYRTDCYTVESPRRIITIIDRNENIQDLFPNAALTYKIEEARDLISFLQSEWQDYASDPYYHQGEPIYPIYQLPTKLKDVERRAYSRNITAYRYKQAGEYIYGITNKWTETEADGRRKKAVECSMDGWERWLSDREQMLLDKWTAENYGNLED